MLEYYYLQSVTKRRSREVYTSIGNPEKVLMIGNSGLPWQDFLKLNPMSLF
jgi:hypothetical protein